MNETGSGTGSGNAGVQDESGAHAGTHAGDGFIAVRGVATTLPGWRTAGPPHERSRTGVR